MDGIFTPEIMNLIMEIVGLILAVILMAVGNLLRNYLRKKLGDAKYEELKAYAETIVRFLDQFGASIGLGTPEQKKIYATNKLFAFAEKLGLDISMEEIGILVEAAWHNVKFSKVIPAEVVEGEG